MQGLSVRERLAAPVRRALHSGAARWPRFRRVVRIGARELERALHDDVYEGDYCAAAATRWHALEIGTADYTRHSTHADVGAYLIWRWFPVSRTLDVGCAFRLLRRSPARARHRCGRGRREPVPRSTTRRSARGHVRVRQPAAPGAVPDRCVRPRVRCSRRSSTCRPKRPEGVARTAPAHGQVPDRDDPVVRTERQRSRRMVRSQGAARPPRRLPVRGDEYTGPVPYEDLARDERGPARRRPPHGRGPSTGGHDGSRPPGSCAAARSNGGCTRSSRRFGPHEVLEPLRLPCRGRARTGRRAPHWNRSRPSSKLRLAEFLADPDDVARVKVVLGDDWFDGVPLIYANGERSFEEVGVASDEIRPAEVRRDVGATRAPIVARVVSDASSRSNPTSNSGYERNAVPRPNGARVRASPRTTR